MALINKSTLNGEKSDRQSFKRKHVFDQWLTMSVKRRSNRSYGRQFGEIEWDEWWESRRHFDTLLHTTCTSTLQYVPALFVVVDKVQCLFSVNSEWGELWWNTLEVITLGVTVHLVVYHSFFVDSRILCSVFFYSTAMAFRVHNCCAGSISVH